MFDLIHKPQPSALINRIATTVMKDIIGSLAKGLIR